MEVIIIMSNIHVFNIKDTTIEIELGVDNSSNNSHLSCRMYFADDEKFQQEIKSIYQDDILSKEWCIKKFKALGHIYQVPCTDTIFVSLGDKDQFSLMKYLQVLNKLANFVKTRVIHTIVWTNFSLFNIYPEQAKKIFSNQDEMYKLVLFYFLSEFYYFDLFKSKKNEQFINKVILEDSNYSVQKFSNVCKKVYFLLDGLFLVRDLGNSPANFMTPSKLSEYAVDMKNIDNVSVKILNKQQIADERMHSFLAVAQGSEQEPKFIEMKYQGTDKSVQPIVLVGKGITFDTGGISLKPITRMDDMKFDMCGAATVIGIFNTVAKLELPLNLIVLVPTCENMPSGLAVKPGDIVKSRSGKTIEILNTDAEGRLILCDALDYAKQFNPKLVIDVATLTGACVVALGTILAGMYSNKDEIATKLSQIGEQTGDRVWRMPLMEEYGEKLKSQYADIANIATTWNGHGGSAKAAWFLYEFTYNEDGSQHYDWVHLDIAGVNQLDSGMATGRPFMLLVEFLSQDICA
jgi:leucyl aminopeptidase